MCLIKVELDHIVISARCQFLPGTDLDSQKRTTLTTLDIENGFATGTDSGKWTREHDLRGEGRRLGFYAHGRGRRSLDC